LDHHDAVRLIALLGSSVSFDLQRDGGELFP